MKTVLLVAILIFALIGITELIIHILFRFLVLEDGKRNMVVILSNDDALFQVQNAVSAADSLRIMYVCQTICIYDEIDKETVAACKRIAKDKANVRIISVDEYVKSIKVKGDNCCERRKESD